MGLFHALWWVHDLRLDNVDFAFDSKKVVYHFNKGSDDVVEFGSILNVNISVILILKTLLLSLVGDKTMIVHTLAKVATSIQ